LILLAGKKTRPPFLNDGYAETSITSMSGYQLVVFE
jgi:hypothetical protein